MPWPDFAHLSDKDAYAIAKYLKSIPPVAATFAPCAAAGAAHTPRRPAHSATDIVALQIARLIQPSTRNGSQAPGRTGL